MNYRGKLHLSVILELDINADNPLAAEQLVKDYENLLLSNEWLAEYAKESITSVNELSYCSSTAIAEPQGLKLG